MSIRLHHYTILLVMLFSATACSNNVSKKVEKKSVIKHRVENKAVPNKIIVKKYASLGDEWSKKSLAPVQKKIIVKKKKPKIKKIVKVAKRQKQKPAKLALKAKKRIIKKKKIVRKVNKPRAKSPSRLRPINNIQYANLSGDYKNNQEAQAFIKKMVSNHGFSRGYMNYVLSETEATSFLKRMAYKDAFGRKKTGKKYKAKPGKWNRYRGNFLTKKTINKGLEFWKNNRIALKRAEQIYGVPQEYILGIIGVETRYGGNVGKNRAIDALAAMGFNNPRRGKYFQSELEAYLLMTRKEGLDPLKPMASYAGALGLSQFMPSNIKRYAVDHDKSGSVNLWTPHDAIGSVANYFKKHGWKTGGTVAVPAISKNSRYKAMKTGFKSKYSLSYLKNKGVSANRLGNIMGKASLIKLNTYSGDELWLGGHNFYVITRYNHSTHYAMAVHQLAEEIGKRIYGKSPIRQASTVSDYEKLLSMY